MTEKDLKPGYRVVLGDGTIGLLMLEGDKKSILSSEGIRVTADWTLATKSYQVRTDGNFNCLDYIIYKVYDIAKNIEIFSLGENLLLWEHDPAPIKMTVQQICDVLGYEVEIVK